MSVSCPGVQKGRWGEGREPVRDNQARRKQATGALCPGAVGGTRTGGEQPAEAVEGVHTGLLCLSFPLHWAAFHVPYRLDIGTGKKAQGTVPKPGSSGWWKSYSQCEISVPPAKILHVATDGQTTLSPYSVALLFQVVIFLVSFALW